MNHDSARTSTGHDVCRAHVTDLNRSREPVRLTSKIRHRIWSPRSAFPHQNGLGTGSRALRACGGVTAATEVVVFPKKSSRL
jgi:hypothetical protein